MNNIAFSTGRVGCIAAVLVALALTGCVATRYRPLGRDGPPGYISRQMPDGAWDVRFKGDEHCPLEKAFDFALLRAAELTLEQGFTRFEILARANGEDRSRGFVYGIAGGTQTSVGVSAATGGSFTQTTRTGGSVRAVPSWRFPIAGILIRMMPDAPTESGHEIVVAAEAARTIRAKYKL